MPSGLPMTKSSLSSSLNSSGGTFNSNSSLNSTPTADRYAALKDLDEQLREVKPPSSNGAPTESAGNQINKNKAINRFNVYLIPYQFLAVPVNPFKNPFQPQQQIHQQPPPQQHQHSQQSYQNWTIPESQSPFNGFGSPVNGFGSPVNTNGFYFNHNNGIISPPTAFGKGGFGNPFVVS